MASVCSERRRNLACPFCFCISYLALPGVLGREKLESASKLDLAELEVSV